MAGLAGGLAIGRRVARFPRPMPHLRGWQAALAGTRGTVPAALLAARIQEHYDALYAGRPRFRQRALRAHLAGFLLPGLALYRALCDEGAGPQAALDEVDRLFAASLQRPAVRAAVGLLERLPDPFAVLRTGNRLAMRWVFPSAGWSTEWLEDGEQAVAYNIHACFYNRMLSAYGAPELAASFCRLDDLLYGSLPGIAWQRTQTIGRGDRCCDFRFSPATGRALSKS